MKWQGCSDSAVVMRRRRVRQAVAVACCAIAFSAGALAQVAKDLESISGERDPVRRYRLALDYGYRAASDCGKACRAGDYERCLDLVQEVQRSVEMAQKALDDTGIDPARNARHHKPAEIRVRRILKLLEDVRSYVHPEDREEYESAVKAISEIDDELLKAIMSRRKR